MLVLWVLILYILPPIEDFFERRRTRAVRLPDSPAQSGASPAMAWAPSPGQYKPPSLWLTECRTPELADDSALPPPSRPYAASRHDAASPSPPPSPYSPRNASDPLLGTRFVGHPYANAGSLSTPSMAARHPYQRTDSGDSRGPASSAGYAPPSSSGHGPPSSHGHSSAGHSSAWGLAA